MTMEQRIARVKELMPEINEIKDAELAGKVAEIWAEVWAESEFVDTDLGLMERRLSPEVSVGNLIEHVRGVTHMSCAIARQVEIDTPLKVNFDYLIATALLHDAAAPMEFHLEGGKTRLGQLTSHSSYAVIKCFEKNLPVEIAHGVQSHSYNSSKKPPATLEAMIVHYGDFAAYDAVQFSKGAATMVMKHWR